jgi:probable phosphoglycerate mutase
MIYFVRHGETDGNASGTVRGKAFDDELNARGREQAKQVAEKLKGVDFFVCCCSPLARTRQTSGYIFSGETVYDERLLPREYGNLVGKTIGEAIEKKFWDRSLNLTEMGCERILDFEKRVFECLDEITQKHKGKNVLVVGHGSSTRIVRAYGGGLPKDDQYMSDINAPKNCEIVIINN